MREPVDDVLLGLTFPVTDQWGTPEELQSRHDLEDVLDALLRQHQVGECTGGGQGLGQQDIDLTVARARWHAAWELVQAKLAELGLLDRATVRIYLRADDPRQLWPPAQGSPLPLTSRPGPLASHPPAAPAQPAHESGSLAVPVPGGAG